MPYSLFSARGRCDDTWWAHILCHYPKIHTINLHTSSVDTAHISRLVFSLGLDPAHGSGEEGLPLPNPKTLRMNNKNSEPRGFLRGGLSDTLQARYNAGIPINLVQLACGSTTLVSLISASRYQMQRPSSHRRKTSSLTRKLLLLCGRRRPISPGFKI